MGRPPPGPPCRCSGAWEACSQWCRARWNTPGRSTVLPVFVVAAAVLILGVQRLNVPELTELSRVVGRGLQQRLVISHNLTKKKTADFS